MQLPYEFTCALECNAQVQPTLINTHKEGITIVVGSLENKLDLIRLQEDKVPHKTTTKMQALESQHEGKLMFINVILYELA
jgi:hypothetical protein